MFINNVINLQIAELTFCLDASDCKIHLDTPPSHAKFLRSQTDRQGYFNPNEGGLFLSVRDQPSLSIYQHGIAIQRAEIWELWQDDAGRYTFIAPRHLPPQYLRVNQDYSKGEICSDYSSNNGIGIYPIFNDLEIVFFVNWLGSFGDLLLHASGVVMDGKGYAFIGTAGAGKSTLAATLAKDRAVTVLGEDQVILRFMDGRFWIYGTPWHLNPDMCSAQGVPLEKLFFLDRNGSNGTKFIKPIEGITNILKTAFIPYYRPNVVSKIMDRLTILAEQVPFHSLSYTLGSDVQALIRHA